MCWLPWPASRISTWAVGVHVGVIVSIVSIAQIVLGQHIYRQWIEHVFSSEAKNSNTIVVIATTNFQRDSLWLHCCEHEYQCTFYEFDALTSIQCEHVYIKCLNPTACMWHSMHTRCTFIPCPLAHVNTGAYQPCKRKRAMPTASNK